LTLEKSARIFNHSGKRLSCCTPRREMRYISCVLPSAFPAPALWEIHAEQVKVWVWSKVVQVGWRQLLYLVWFSCHISWAQQSLRSICTTSLRLDPYFKWFGPSQEVVSGCCSAMLSTEPGSSFPLITFFIVSHWTFVTLLPVKHFAFYDALKVIRYNVNVLSWCISLILSLSIANGKWWLSETCFFVTVVLNMWLHAWNSRVNTLLCYTIVVRMPEMLLACEIMLQCPLCYVLGCARYRILCLAAQLNLT